MMGGGRGVIWKEVIRLRDSLETWNLYHGLIKEFFVIVVASLYAIALQTGRHVIRPLRLSFVFDYQKIKVLIIFVSFGISQLYRLTSLMLAVHQILQTLM